MKKFEVILSDTIRDIRKNKELLYLIVLYSLIDMSVSIFFFYGRKIFSDSEFSEGTTGSIYMLYYVLGAVSSFFVHKFHFKGKKIEMFGLFTLTTLVFLLYSFVDNEWLMVIFFILIGVLSSMIIILLSDSINSMVLSYNRATILSLRGAIFSFSMVLFFPLVGWISEIIGLSKTLKVMSIVLTIIIFIISYAFVKKK